MRFVELLRHNGVQPLMIFDGAQLPAKRDTELERRRAREEHREKARAHLRAGNTGAAAECYQRAVDITPRIARGLMDALEDAGVAFLVAPYEADAQMAYLAHRGLVHAIVTEDSDLLAYYCPRVLYKIDRVTGMGQEICVADLPRARELGLQSFTRQHFLEMCIMSGCDFLPSLPSIGIKKAYGAIRQHRGFVKACRQFRYDPNIAVPRDYEEAFQRALWTFQHQTVWCPDRKALAHVNEIPPEGLVPATGVRLPVLKALDAPVTAPLGPEELPPEDPLAFLGPFLPREVAEGVAEGRIDPETWQHFSPRAQRRPPSQPAASLSQQPHPPPRGESGAGAGPSSMRGPAAPGPQLQPITNFFASLNTGYPTLADHKEAGQPFKPPSFSKRGAASQGLPPKRRALDDADEVSSPPPSKPRAAHASKFFSQQQHQSQPTHQIATVMNPANVTAPQARLLEVQGARQQRFQPPPPQAHRVGATALAALDAFRFRGAAGPISAPVVPVPSAGDRPLAAAPAEEPPFAEERSFQQSQKEIDNFYEALSPEEGKRGAAAALEPDDEEAGAGSNLVRISLAHIPGFASLAAQSLDRLELRVARGGAAAAEIELDETSSWKPRHRKRVREPEDASPSPVKTGGASDEEPNELFDPPRPSRTAKPAAPLKAMPHVDVRARRPFQAPRPLGAGSIVADLSKFAFRGTGVRKAQLN